MTGPCALLLCPDVFDAGKRHSLSVDAKLSAGGAGHELMIGVKQRLHRRHRAGPRAYDLQA